MNKKISKCFVLLSELDQKIKDYEDLVIKNKTVELNRNKIKEVRLIQDKWRVKLMDKIENVIPGFRN